MNRNHDLTTLSGARLLKAKRIEILDCPRVAIDGEAIRLRPAGYRAMAALVSNMPDIVSKPRLRHLVCFYHDLGEEASDNSLKVQMCYLRRALRPTGLMLRNLWGDGYCLMWAEDATW